MANPEPQGAVPVRRIPRLLREKTSEKVYPKTLFITALTAITLAVISAKLTGLVNSLVLVALASVGTAVVSEFYRLALEGSRKAIAIAVSRTVERRLGELTGDVPPVTAEVIEAEVNRVEAERAVEARPVVWLFFHRLFVSRWAVPIVFTLVALGTVLGSYFVGKVTAKPEFNVVREITETRDISDSRANAIEQEAKETAVQEAEAAGEEAEDEAASMVSATRADLIARIEALELQLEQAEAAQTADEELVRDLTETIRLLQLELIALQERIEELEQEDPRLAPEEPQGNPDAEPEPDPPATDPEAPSPQQ